MADLKIKRMVPVNGGITVEMVGPDGEAHSLSLSLVDTGMAISNLGAATKQALDQPVTDEVPENILPIHEMSFLSDGHGLVVLRLNMTPHHYQDFGAMLPSAPAQALEALRQIVASQTGTHVLGKQGKTN